MPKKTRKEKIHADMHKLTTTLPPSYTYVTKTVDHLPASDSPTASSVYIRRDLLKTLTLGSLFIATEILLTLVLA